MIFLFHRHSPCITDSKESTCNTGDLGSVPGSGRSSGEGNGNSLQYSCLENPTDRGAWGCQGSDMTEWLLLLHRLWTTSFTILNFRFQRWGELSHLSSQVLLQVLQWWWFPESPVFLSTLFPFSIFRMCWQLLDKFEAFCPAKCLIPWGWSKC